MASLFSSFGLGELNPMGLDKLTGAWKQKRPKVTKSMTDFQAERFLDQKTIAKLVNMTFQDPALRAMIDLVSRTILKNGVTISESTEMFKGSRKEQFYKFIDKEYRRFFTECLYHLFALGFCAYTWKPHEEFGARPMCIDLQSVRVGVSRNCIGELSFSYTALGGHFGLSGSSLSGRKYDISGDPIKRREPEILTHYVTPPSMDGTIHSHMTALLDDVYLNEMKRKCAIQSDISRARPTVFISRKDEKQDGMQALGQAVAFHTTQQCPNNSFQSGLGPNINLGDPVALKRRGQSAAMAYALSRGLPAGISRDIANGNSPGSGGVYSDYVNVERLKDGFVVEKAPHQSEGPDYLRWRSEFEERSSFLIGVPKMLWSNSNASRKHKTLASGGEDSADKILANTVRYWSTQLSAIGSSSYAAMFRDHHLMLRNLEINGLISARKSKMRKSRNFKPPEKKQKEKNRKIHASAVVPPPPPLPSPRERQSARQLELDALLDKWIDHKVKADEPPDLEEDDGDATADAMQKGSLTLKRKRQESVVKIEASREDNNSDEEEEEEEENQNSSDSGEDDSSSHLTRPVKRVKTEAASLAVATSTRGGRAERVSQNNMREALRRVSGQPADDGSSGVNEDPGSDEDGSGEESSGDEDDGELFHFKSSISAEFIFPGVVEMRHVEALHNAGLMKTSAFRLYASRQYGIPLEDIESKAIAPPPSALAIGQNPGRQKPQGAAKPASSSVKPNPPSKASKKTATKPAEKKDASQSDEKKREKKKKQRQKRRLKKKNKKKAAKKKKAKEVKSSSDDDNDSKDSSASDSDDD